MRGLYDILPPPGRLHFHPSLSLVKLKTLTDPTSKPTVNYDH